MYMWGESDEAPIEAILACTSTTDTLIQLVRIMYDTGTSVPERAGFLFKRVLLIPFTKGGG
jgi:hypothetical protein